MPPAPVPDASDQIPPASLGVNTIDAPTVTNLAVLPDIANNTNSAMETALQAMPAPAAAPLPQAGFSTPAGALLDAQSIQAQVEALIQSTSSSVAASTANNQAATHDPSLAPLIPAPSPTVPVSAQTDVAVSLAAPGPTALQEVAIMPALPAVGIVPQTAASDAADSMDAAAIAAGPSFQNTFAQYQFPQNHDRALKDAVLATSAVDIATPVKKEQEVTSVLTREEEERAADALIADIDAQDATAATTLRSVTLPKLEPFSGADLAAAAKAIGIEADADLLSGTSEDQRALAAAIKRLGDEHGEAAQKAIQQAAAAAAAAAAARASQELARAAAKEQGATLHSSAGTSAAAGPSRSSSVPSPTSGRSSSGGPKKRFPCPKCDKAFARAYNLNTHLSTHDPDPNRSKPFPCPYPSCKSEGGRSFSRKHDLQRHVASIHENEAEPGIHGDPEEVVGGDTGGLVSLGLGTPGKKFRCNNCGRSFVRRDACNRHQCDDSPSARTSNSPSGTHYAASISPRPSASKGMEAGGASTAAVALPPVRSTVASPAYSGGSGTTSRGSPAAAAAAAGRGRQSSSLSKEVQAVAKQLQARVEAQSPGPQDSHGSQLSAGLPPPHQRNMAPLPGGGERRNFPLSAISLYASMGPSGKTAK